MLYLWPGSGGSCFSSLAIADSFGLGRGTSSTSFAGVEAAFETRSSSRLLWLQTKIDVQFILRNGRHEIINSVFWKCRAWRQQESFKDTSWLHAITTRLNSQYKTQTVFSFLTQRKEKQVKRTGQVWTQLFLSSLIYVVRVDCVLQVNFTVWLWLKTRRGLTSMPVFKQ